MIKLIGLGQPALRVQSTLALAVAAFLVLAGPRPSAYAVNLVANGGFEAGDVTGWTVAHSALGGTYGVDNTGVYAHSGSCAATLGPYGADGLLSSQSFPTTAGQQYELTYWVANISDAQGHIYNNDFYAAWNGAEILASALFNVGPFDYARYDFIVTGAAGTSSVSFGMRQDPMFFALDDVSVTPTPEPAAAISLALLGIAACRPKRT